MYYRLYPSKTNTIFRKVDEPYGAPWSVNINTGLNTIMELYDGAYQSNLLFGFDLPTWLQAKLSANPFVCRLNMFDAGTLYEPALPLKDINVNFFADFFAQGSGWAFQKPKAVPGVSNWNFRADGYSWDETTMIPAGVYSLSKDNEDMFIDISNIVASHATMSAPFNFSVSVANPTSDTTNTLTKFIYSGNTNTVFKPYLEFNIDDTIIDRTFDFMAGRDNKIYLINQNGIDFNGAITASVMDNAGTVTHPVVTRAQAGIHYITINPSEPTMFIKKEYNTVTWSIGGTPFYKQTLQVKPQNLLTEVVDMTNLFFYPQTPYTNGIVRQGDVIPFTVVSQIRSKGDVVNTKYEYRIVSSDGYEMVPWTQVSVYKDQMYFNVNTTYFFPEMGYEVFVRNNQDDYSITSNLTHKFKLATNTTSHLRDLTSNPYYSREIFFSK